MALQDHLCRWLPRHCLLCRQLITASLPICHACQQELPWLRDCCPICALPLPVSGTPCGRCLIRPPAFSRTIAAWHYAFPVDSLINRFKHQADWPYGKLLTALLIPRIRQQQDQSKPALLLPVPLARRRQRQRGFNQAGMMARWLAAKLHCPVHEHWLQRIRDTPAQQGLDASARRRNLRHAFALSEAARVQGRHIALVDDVLTTGATAETLSRLLLRAGASRVDLYCLARTPLPG